MLSAGSRSLTPPHQTRARKLSFLTSSWLLFYTRLHLIASCCRLSKGPKLSFHFRLSCREQKPIRFRSLSGPPVFFSHSYLRRVPLTCYSPTTCLLYLSIHSISDEPFNYVTWCVHRRTSFMSSSLFLQQVLIILLGWFVK